MKLMIVGSGGREAAMLHYLSKNKKISEIFALPGNAGTAKYATNIDIKATDIDGITDFALSNKIDYAVIAPDDPLVLGAVDRLTEKGIPCFGPTAAAAEIEGSKVFSKGLMKKYGIPTAAYEIFDNAQDALSYIKSQDSYPAVIKADGLALGKGVILAQCYEEAEEAMQDIFEKRIFGNSGSRVVVEEFMTGPEVSALCLVDGKTVKPLTSSMDFKRIGEGNTGANTGGMGAIAPNPYYDANMEQLCMDKIFMPTVDAMNKEGRTFKGCLYFGLMITKDGPKVIEYNCRFGDPETQAVLPLIDFDLLDAFYAVTDGRLADFEMKFKQKSSACIVMASGGYPAEYQTGKEITVGQMPKDTELFFAGVKQQGDKLFTAGGRVLGAVAIADSLPQALDNAYKLADKITFENSYIRRDIGRYKED